MNDFRREGPRIEIDALCWEIFDGKEHGSLAVDLSMHGLRVERPYVGGPTRREMLLELEVPGVEEIVWARADACFDEIVRPTITPGGKLGLVRRTGYRIVMAASRDLRLLQEYVVETSRLQQEAYDSFVS